MKKIWLALVGVTTVFGVCCAQFNDGVQYITLDHPVISEPKILEFFSFYCPHCYEFEHIYHISDNIKKALPSGTKIARYHVDFLGPMGKPLTQAWAIALALGIEEKLSPLMFEAVQKAHTIQTLNDIRSVFVKAGVNAVDYDAACNSLAVRSIYTQQEKAAENLQVRSVPVVFVNGKYMLKNDGLDTSSISTYVKQFTEIVKFLN